MINVNCNLCGQDSTKLLFKSWDRQHKIDKQKFNVVKCKNCSLVYLNPQPGVEELKKYYPDDYQPYNEGEVFKYGWLAGFLKRVALSFRPNSETPRQACASVPTKAGTSRLRQSSFGDDGRPADNQNGNNQVNYLDFGCGDGHQLESIRAKHPEWRLIGYDNNQQACDTARQRGFEVICGDDGNLDLPENYFDIVNLSHVIEHLNNPKTALTKINQTLKSGGQLIIATPNFDSLAAKVFRTFWFGLETPRHLYLFTPKTLENILTKAGFNVKNIKYKEGLSVEFKSLYYLLGRKDLRISPVIWRVTRPLAKLLKRLEKTSIIIFKAEKI